MEHRVPGPSSLSSPRRKTSKSWSAVDEAVFLLVWVVASITDLEVDPADEISFASSTFAFSADISPVYFFSYLHQM